MRVHRALAIAVLNPAAKNGKSHAMRPGSFSAALRTLAAGTGRRGRVLLAAAGLATVAGPGLLAAQPHLELLIGHSLAPTEIRLHRGDTIYIVNDDGSVVHHPYIRSPGFSFDRGDLAPGTDSKVTFLVNGTFVIGCGIHPNLRSRVTVE